MRLLAILRTPLWLTVFVIFFFVNVGRSATLPLYPDAMIREWEPEFRTVVLDNYARLFRPKLDTQEAQRLRTLRFEFPTDPERVLFEFATHSDGAVVLPVASLLLLKDLVAAQVWLEANGYSAQTLLDYLAIVRWGRLGDWPRSERLPLKALGIPTGAISNEHLLEKRNDILDKTIFFILGHELGHLVHGFSAQAACDKERQRTRRVDSCDFAALQKSEAQADAFAVDMLRRIGLVPSASNFFFAAYSRLSPMPFEFHDKQAWQDYAKTQAHPLDSARIRNVAALIEGQKDAFARGFPSPAIGSLRVDNVVKELKTLSDILDDRDLAGMQIAWAKSLKPEDIRPRRSHEPRLRPTTEDLAAKQPWTGFFIGTAQYASGGSAPLEVIMRVNGSGQRITGDVMLGGIRGRIEGRYEDATHASATWTVAGDTYRLTFVASSTPGHLNASYQSTVDSAKGHWILERRSSVR
jgi:hypothetical protein